MFFTQFINSMLVKPLGPLSKPPKTTPTPPPTSNIESLFFTVPIESEAICNSRGIWILGMHQLKEFCYIVKTVNKIHWCHPLRKFPGNTPFQLVNRWNWWMKDYQLYLQISSSYHSLIIVMKVFFIMYRAKPWGLFLGELSLLVELLLPIVS